MYVDCTAKVFDISRGSLHDGPGIRTVVYLKGCNLHCQWCHNPEGISFEPQNLFVESKCIGCNLCKNKADPGACPSGALKTVGKQMTLDEVYDEIVKDKHYYDFSGGGVTFSGGECLLQPEFIENALIKCKNSGINTAIETAFYTDFDSIKKIIHNVDTLFIDIKLMDAQLHKKYTGVSNEKILSNIRDASALHHNIVIRVPLIPSINDSDENLIETARFVLSCGIKNLELLKYNNLAASKYSQLGEETAQFSATPQTDSEMQEKLSFINAVAGTSTFAY